MLSCKVLLVDDFLAIREGMLNILQRISGLEVAAVCASAEEALEAVAHQPFDLALTDLQLGEENGILLGRKLVKLDPNLKVIVYTKEASIVIAAEVFRHEYNQSRLSRSRRAHNLVVGDNGNGLAVLPPDSISLHGYLLLKNITPLSLQHSIETLQEQGNVIDPEIVDLLLERLQRQKLTPRETECCELISRGKGNREIAQHLGITQQAVENLINSLYNKLSIGGDPKDPGRRVLLARTVERWIGLSSLKSSSQS